MQQGGGGSLSLYAPEGGSPPPLPAPSSSSSSSHQHGLVVEEASPISSRPPALEMDAFAEAPERGGNRWPRQETVALLKIRSEMDATFRDASLKGPLWEDVSRKMAELGYRRSAKKCKEKFENVHKYYKRTKEGRAGKTSKFFSELEAFQAVASPPPPPHPVSLGAQFGNPVMPVAHASHDFPGVAVTGAAIVPPASPLGLMSSSNSSSLSPGSGDDDDDIEGEGEPSTAGSSRKRKRAAEMLSASEGRRMMEYFEGLMKRVVQKQKEMQKRFLEAIEKREQDRLTREEAWRRQEMYRLACEHELMAQERAVSASRDATIMSFLQKITGQTIQLPTTTTLTAVPVASPRVPPPPRVPAAASPTSWTQHQQRQQQPMPQPPQTYHRPTPPVSREVIAAIPEQKIPPPPQEIIGTIGDRVGGSGEVPSSSRWPKAEVLALIRLRSGMESKYLEAGPKGPLWEEISAGMHQLGYKRNPKRCKEKWENINKYFKKVKESNKKRPEDAKTCPYFHELDSLYRMKVLSSQSTGIDIRSEVPTNVVTEEAPMGGGSATAAGDSERPKDGGPDDEETENAKKPEDAAKEMNYCLDQQARTVDLGDNKAEEAADHNNPKQDENEGDLVMDDDEDEEETEEEESKMAYKIEYQQQRQNSGTPNGSGSGSTPSFATMVQ